VNKVTIELLPGYDSSAALPALVRAYGPNDAGDYEIHASDADRVRRDYVYRYDIDTGVAHVVPNYANTGANGEPVYRPEVSGPLPPEAAARKAIPIATGFIDYFPDAIVAIAELSRIGNDQHNPGKPLFWDRSKSKDEADALMRHFLERGAIDTDGVRHSTKVAWRALALLQKELEAARGEDA